MKLSQIIKIIKKNEYTTTTAKGERKSVDVDTLISEIKSLQLEQSNKRNQLKEELDIVHKLGFQEISKNIFKFLEKDTALFFDYRNGTRRSWSSSIVDYTMQDKTELIIYRTFKQLLQKIELKVENNINIVCDICGNNDVKIYGSSMHEVRKYKCLKCSRVFEVK